jgi:hypothetical protein
LFTLSVERATALVKRERGSSVEESRVPDPRVEGRRTEGVGKMEGWRRESGDILNHHNLFYI